jgi:uncharacterized protein YjbI with pentapeptide repeats
MPYAQPIVCRRPAVHVLTGKHCLSVTNADVSGSRFDDVNMSGWTLHDVNMSGMRVDEANLAGLHVSNANLAGAQITDCRLEGMTINGVLVTDLLAAYESARGRDG